MKQKKINEEKIPPTPDFEAQDTQCLVQAALSSPPGGWTFFLNSCVQH